jgi:hypothetical protein
MKDEWVLVLPCGDQVIDTILALKSLGYRVLGVDESPSAVGFQYCDLYLASPIDKYETILSFISNNKLNVICSIPIVSDKAVFPSYMLNLHFANSVSNPNILAYFSKSFLRNLFKNSNLKCNPLFKTYKSKEIDLDAIDFKKFIIKPDDSSGSRGVNIVDQNSRIYIEDYINEAFAYSSNSSIIIEEYIEGTEYMIDCFVEDYKLLALLVSKKHKVEDKVSYLIQSIPVTYFPENELDYFLNQVIESLGFQKGPLHIEVKYINNNFYVLDLAARGGGFGVFNYYTKKCLGFNFVEANINAYLKRKIVNTNIDFRYGAMYFVRPERSGILKEVIIDYINIDNHDIRIDYFYKSGQNVSLEVNDGNRLAGIYCFAESELKLNKLLEDIIKTIKQIYI